MSRVARIDSLKDRHSSLDTTLSKELARPSPDETALLDLKRQKLAIKDEIVRLETH